MTKDLSIPKNLSEIDAAIWLVRVSDKATSMTRELLHAIFEARLWEGRFTSFDDFVESPDGLDKSRGWASKNLQVHKWIRDNNFSSESTEGIDTERLYLASKLDESPDRALAKAQTLSREELKAEKRDEVPCDEHTPVTYCTKCNVRL